MPGSQTQNYRFGASKILEQVHTTQMPKPSIAEHDLLELVDPHLLAVCTLVPNFFLLVPLDHPSFSSI
jgi:hypothetical protein